MPTAEVRFARNTSLGLDEAYRISTETGLNMSTLQYLERLGEVSYVDGVLTMIAKGDRGTAACFTLDRGENTFTMDIRQGLGSVPVRVGVKIEDIDNLVKRLP